MKLIFEYDENDSKHVSDIQDNDDYYDNNNGKKLVKPDIQVELPNDLLRKELPLPNVSEPTVVRHYTNMSQMNYGIDLGFYPLGSCTMKYNPKVNEDIARLHGFQNLHPLSHEDCNQGSLQLMWELEQDLKTITGMDAFSLQPAAGAQAELLGVMMTKA
jgi:glycine dehydrogenase subunit 2